MTHDIRTIPSNVTVVRDSADGEMKIKGYALEFNKPSQPIPFIEYILPNALDNVDLSNVLLLYGHEYNSILAKTTAGTLTLTVDKTGLFFTATLPDTTLGRDTYNNILAGNLSGMSFGFTIADDTWSVDKDGNTIHTINAIQDISEISVTPIPAYTETSVEVTRSLENFKKGNSTMDNSNIFEALQALTEQVQALGDAKEPTKAPESKEAEPATEEAPAEEPKEPEATPAKEEDKAEEEPAKERDEEVEEPTERDEAEDTEADDSTPAEPEEDTQERSAEPEQEGDHTMATIISEPKESAQVRAFTEYITKNEVRDASAFSTVDGGAVIPTEILNIYKQPKDSAQLSGYVNKVAVSAPTGKLPILAKASARLITAQEGIDNPAIAKAQLSAVNYDVVTYRGQLPITFEMAKDYSGIVSLMSEYVQDVVAQTEQHNIGAVLQQATPVAASSVDDLKSAYNVGLTNYTDKMFVVTESMYNTLDQQKDNQGRYLLQDSIASATGKTLLGAPVVVVADDVLGANGDSKAFVGSVKSFVLETVKDNVSVEWVRNESFTTNLAVALRADYKVADALAGKFITFAPKSSK